MIYYNTTNNVYQLDSANVVKLVVKEKYVYQKPQYIVIVSAVEHYILWFLELKALYGFIVGNSKTSRMEAESVSSMTRRSTPKPSACTPTKTLIRCKAPHPISA